MSLSDNTCPKCEATVGQCKCRELAAPTGSASVVIFNINDYVQVRLTQRGHAILRDNYEKLKEACRGKLPFQYEAPKEDENGWSRWQAWSLMQDFGPHISMGLNPPFETDIRIEVKRQNKD